MLTLGALPLGCAGDGERSRPLASPPAAPSDIDREAGSPPAPARVDAPAAAPGRPAGLVTLVPGLRIDGAQRIVEVDGWVPIDPKHPDTPHAYLEVIACPPDTRGHEALVEISVPPSQVHAALLAIGLNPGAPAKWVRSGDLWIEQAPSGDPVIVELVTVDAQGLERISKPEDWIVHVETRVRYPAMSFVFAGSFMGDVRGRPVYDADLSGTFIGLATFGGETIAPTVGFHHEAAIAAPVWIADKDAIPDFGAPVTIRIRPGSGASP